MSTLFLNMLYQNERLKSSTLEMQHLSGLVPKISLSLQTFQGLLAETVMGRSLIWRAQASELFSAEMEGGPFCKREGCQERLTVELNLVHEDFFSPMFFVA